MRAFPLESQLPTIFEITEQSSQLLTEAWQKLLKQSESAQQKELKRALQCLFEFCFGFNGARTALFAFMEARNEWMAFTHQKPSSFASNQLTKQIGELSQQTRLVDNPAIEHQLEHVIEILGLSEHTSHQDKALQLNRFLSLTRDNDERLNHIQDIFLIAWDLHSLCLQF